MCLNLPFHHIGIACYNIEETSQFFIQTGYSLSPAIYDSIQNVNIAFLSKKGNPLIELISPHDETSPVNKNLQKNGVSPYHICYETENLEETIAELKKLKFLLVSRPAAAVAMEKRRVCFLFSKNAGLIELVEKAVL